MMTIGKSWTSRNGNSVFIDDINIGEFALSTTELGNDTPWKVFPNPAQSNFVVKTESKASDTTIVKNGKWSWLFASSETKNINSVLPNIRKQKI